MSFPIRERTPADLILSNVVAEGCTIGLLLWDNSTADLIADKIDDRDFAESVYGRAYSLILREIGAGRRINATLLAPMMQDDDAFREMGGLNLLNSLQQAAMIDTTGAPLGYAAQIRHLAIQRRVTTALRAVIEKASVMGADLPAIVSEADALLTGAVDNTDPTFFIGAEDCFDEVIAGFNREQHGIRSGVIGTLDTLLGRLQPGWLVIVGARPGMGKTALALSYMRGAAMQGHGVLFASLEMAWETLSLRFVADACYDDHRIPFAAFTNYRLNRDQQMAIVRAKRELGSMPFKVVDKNCHTLGQLRRAIRRRKRELRAAGQSLELVIVDYLQLLQPDGKPKSEYEAVSEVSRELKIMAGDEGVTIIALSQLSRRVEQRQDKRPNLDDLRASGQIEQDADIVLFLLSQEYYLVNGEPEPGTAEHLDWEAKLERNRHVLELICAKHRHSSIGSAFAHYDRSHQAVRSPRSNGER
ncbi:DnaB-like helicase C-terminal domain-containing protein [Sphingobium sp. CFD-1]|uniref:replicative DNA helicase n=1 Tax=Sphingobium sp. CFD-1 TaxID=2878545 RepID=UPI00214B0028|nr:DnaB-like helicase C-terminal domain-containing protein [Sphingobium sp. CFD-1]